MLLSDQGMTSNNHHTDSINESSSSTTQATSSSSADSLQSSKGYNSSRGNQQQSSSSLSDGGGHVNSSSNTDEEGHHSYVKRSSSKYDFVKVRVGLENHYYILSRFIVSRILTVIQVKYKDSIKIALELKKTLVDLNLLNIPQEELEKQLFDIMRKYGYGDQTITRYKLMSLFHHKRIPLLILVFGTGCVGKSTLATQLGERLNTPNVVQTDVVLDLINSFNLHSSKNAKSYEKQIPVWFSKFPDKKSFLTQYKEQCVFMKKALQGDIEKCFGDGKSLIIEGSHIDPEIYKDMFETYISNDNQSDKKEGIIIPFFISVSNKEEHELFFEQWLSKREHDIYDSRTHTLGTNFDEKLQTLSENFQYMQEYYEESTTNMPYIHKVVINHRRLDETLDTLHNCVLDRIFSVVEKIKE
ncbi:hypothetical protein C9374_011395 [Naegleria lovaniensis]|uniref:2-phosphoglycerate kinase n=1 Tax=Naegleria lovaniensis TaxID=51637 RepID=A0AA88H0M4_NAELO|nr:uncharacterized protein C9374_011395 [Naegleria lovaniensis]KAG2392670.1 hypothetical protein C9374_011395 [Naegleria lovaniensis]